MTAKVVSFSDAKAQQSNDNAADCNPFIKVDPKALLPIFRKWKATDLQKYSTFVAMVCGAADIQPEELH